jgi:hypothetical protein
MTVIQNKILTFNQEKHEYKEDGVIIPSVTQCIQKAGLIDLSFVEKELLEYKSDVGTKIHKTTELYDQGNLDEATLHPLLAGFLQAWKKFIKDYQFIPMHIELKRVHPLYKYAGMIDRIGTIIDGKTITQIDIKTGVHHHSYAIQSGGYTELYNYGKPKKEQIKRRLTVYLREDGMYEVKEYKSPNDIRIFLAALTITNYLRGVK